MANGSEAKIKIYMLGRFAVEYDGNVVLQDEGKVHKVWTLFGYLLANHGRTLGITELPELLCGDDRSNDPQKAVKNLAYRLRKLLSDSGMPKDDYIVPQGGTYSWNNDLDFSIDMEEFNEVYNQACAEKENPEKAEELYTRAINLYGGDFLPGFEYDGWAVNLSVYYHRIFTECITSLFNILKEKEVFEPMLPVCEKAIAIDEYDELIYKIYIYSLIKLGKHKQALEAYETITSKLYDELGVNPSNELRALYRDIIKTLKSVETDLQVIKEDLNEGGKSKCCYFCEYQIFKDIYRFIARRVSRTGESIYIMLCTLTDSTDDIPDIKFLSEAMDSLKKAIGYTLRKGDVFARYSSSQYVVMLPDAKYEDCKKVAARVKKAYNDYKVSKKVIVHYKLLPLDPKNF